MAKGGAYYAAAGVANQVQPVDFGSIAKGFANVAESKRLEAKADAKYRQDFLMKQQELFGDEVIGEFDGTGIDNVDGVASKVKTAIKNHAEILNSLYEEGKISESQLNSRMRKLSSASAQYRGMVGNISNFIQKHNELGGKSSKYNEMVIERLNSFTEDMLPTVDENSNLVLLSKGGKKGIQQTGMSKIQDMLVPREGIQDSELFQGVMAGIKPSTLVRGDSIVNTYLPNNTLSTNTENYIKEWVSSKSDAEIIDLAVKNNIDYGDGIDIENRDQVEKQLSENYKNKTKAYLIDQEVKNEKDAILLNIQKDRINIAKAQDLRAKKLFDKEQRKATKITDVNEAGQAYEQYNMPIDKAFNIAPFIEGVVGKDNKPIGHLGEVQLTQLTKVNIGTEAQPVYRYEASIYFMQQSGEASMDITPSGISEVIPKTPKYETVTIPEQVYNKFKNIFEDVETQGTPDLNSIILNQ